MGGFLKIAIQAEHFGQSIVNTFGYRSEDWPWLGVGNPFSDVGKVIDDFWANIHAEWLALFNANYRVLQVSGTALTDGWSIATPQPVIKTINAAGSASMLTAGETTGSSVCATLGFIMGSQVQILGSGHSPRNRGYIHLGPVPETYCDSYGHLVNGYPEGVDALAQKLDDTLIDVTLTASFIPVRFHMKRTKVPVVGGYITNYLTYSDIKGYRLPRRASWRRSRMPEA